MTAPSAPAGGGAGASRPDDLSAFFWIEIREPGCAPERKGRFRQVDMKGTLREFIAARPTAYMTVVTIGDDGPWFEDLPFVLQTLDGRLKSVLRRHREARREAFAALASHPQGPAPAATQEGADDAAR